LGEAGFTIKDFKVERWIDTYEDDARYNLAETDAEPFTLEELLSLGDREKLLSDLLNLRITYNPTMGSPRLRDTIAARYARTTAANVLVTGGAVEANFLLANVLIDPGDTVIIQSPAYQALYSVAEARGAKIKHWQMRLEAGYQPDLAELAELIDGKTKAVIINIPHNPTGAVIGQADLETILGWAEAKGFWVICDEVYHDLDLEDGVIPTAARSLSEKAISIGSMSKSYGLSGLRLGWIAAPEDIVYRCWCWKDYTSISNSPLNDYLASFALANTGRIMARNIPMAKQNLVRLLDWYRQNEGSIESVVPRAGVLSFPRLRGLPVSTEEFCLGIYRERGVLLVPGECFDRPGHLRIGFGTAPAKFNQGLDLLSGYLQQVLRQR